ncbi:MAG: hypothetical protein JXX29_01075 [Deltaproteobacteria bacterium]|nr:hypothetical protein [Deltaproteobacteria bacterium]MBN2670230.1 hypothetical protein [Deltaproteobacteria bacterium]
MGKLRVDGNAFDALFYGKSNSSEADARHDAGEQAKRVQARIDGTGEPKESYDVPIREEIVHRIDDRNLITRNRYGALVLNTEDLLFIDIDKPKFGFFEALLGKAKGTTKEQITRMVEARAAKSAYRHLSFRLYETNVGVRVIVQGMQASPVSKQVMTLMRDFNTDPLYAMLCEKQQCYRARLTPKPSRIKCNTPRVIFPRSETEQRTHQEWVRTYEQLSQSAAVCRHIKDIGRFRENRTIRYHDEQTRCAKNLPLA